MSHSHNLLARKRQGILSCLLLLSTALLGPTARADQPSLPALTLSAEPAPQTLIDDGDTAPSKKPLYLQAQFAAASESDFGPAILFYYEQPDQKTNLSSLSVGRFLRDDLFGWPAEVVSYASIQYFGERGFQPDAIGTAFYIKAYKHFKLGKSQFPLRIGLGEGLSYVSRIPIVEVEDFAPDTSAKLTNYLEWTMQTSLNHLLGHGGQRFSPGIKDVYLGYSVFHRSTVFGLFASKGGGVNFMGLSVELVLD
ncbi:hypothetical protein [Granulosicoccus antarcticus]|uniref:Uncharacterized protein n=1 Tax=Granulosicoccus antarcticus IMCC3135 TaxID=1192854 RepID=A0A2Z2NM15_9GAMM|nr:hypothetical protein [Granulosicoccus antarcticus]ASJ70818.1 hypothetical protein IMCC3135_03525 [Granulosicoccus antarcticus IMCC3135]